MQYRVVREVVSGGYFVPFAVYSENESGIKLEGRFYTEQEAQDWINRKHPAPLPREEDKGFRMLLGQK